MIENLSFFTQITVSKPAHLVAKECVQIAAPEGFSAQLAAPYSIHLGFTISIAELTRFHHRFLL